MAWKVMQRNEWKDIANFQIKHLSNFSVATPHMDDHQFKEEEMDRLENYLLFAHKLL